jgi:protoheme IX farnesyltransferase
MLPVVAGRAATTLQILIYSVLLVPTSLLPWALGYAGALYGVVALASGAVFLALALQLRRSQQSDRQAAQRLFLFSISYLFLLFAALLANSSSDRSSSTISSQEEARRITRTTSAAALQLPFRTAIAFIVARSDEA